MHTLHNVFFRISIVGLSLLSLSAVCLAENTPSLREATSVRAAGMAGATRGFAGGTDAILVNPAAIAATSRISISADYLLNTPHKESLLFIGAVDSRINAGEAFELSGGFSYSYYQSGKKEEARQGSLICAALSVPLYPQVLFAGITGKYFRLSGAVKSSATTMDAAIMIKPAPQIGISAIGYNLVDIRNPEAQRSWGGGVAIGGQNGFHLDADLRIEKNSQGKQTISYGAGAEYSISDIVTPRVGYFEDSLRETRSLAGGFSLIYSGLSFDFSYQHALLGSDRRFGVALRIADWTM